MPDDSQRRPRSRSPDRRTSRPSRGGFRWKDSHRRNEERDEPRRRTYRERSRERASERDSYSRDRRPNRDGDRDKSRERATSTRNGSDKLRSPRREDRSSRNNGTGNPERRIKPAASASTQASGEEMIIVNVNDRLGSKSAVPCLPSDTVGQFKIMVAARIGREPNQIMLRRQGERPFKDHITLEDYGISNGVQLDLEIDTGD